MPVAGSQVPAAWHWSAAVQATGLAPTQAPASQVSVCVQALPPLHGAPLGLAGLLQMPVAGSQAPAVWHWSAAVQATGLAPTQAPASQVSVCVQALPSSHGAPLGLAGLLQKPDAGSQPPAVWLWSAAVHTTGLAPTQAPASQVSVRVQALPSSDRARVGLGGMVDVGGRRMLKAEGGDWWAGGDTTGVAATAEAGGEVS